MKLYTKAGACSLSPHIILRETGLDFTLINVDLKARTTEQGEDYLTINPKGQVPALQLDDGSVLTEGQAIVQYLADLKPDRHLLEPTGNMARYRTLEWLSYISSELHKSFSPLFRPGTSDEMKQQCRSVLEQKFRYVDSMLPDQCWLTGNYFTVADAYLFTVLRWGHALKLNLAELAALEAWRQRVAQRPAVIAALQAEGLS
ncbi:glutathione transferase GstA [Izhakiella australiensis]|uniref:Glutathione transferase GstA n=1 Tax=Izhakiella australiensis TaxID=1926881 RepID=A0A1S8YNU2_9GAMM|nr:glutathione transferase GstA [Izhakiella australiensis]OON40426.1 glutathione transferase GstA [Izhakiella australiensis]